MTHTKDEALELALEALKDALDKPMWNRVQIEAAITAIKQALAAPVQEPVAWADMGTRDVDNDAGLSWTPGHFHTTPLYTTPPAAQRQWVGLTDEQIEKVWQRVQANDFHDCVQPFARAIEAAHGITKGQP